MVKNLPFLFWLSNLWFWDRFQDYFSAPETALHAFSTSCRLPRRKVCLFCFSMNSICVPVSVSQNLPCWREWRTAKLEGSSRSRRFWRFPLTLNPFKLVQIVTSHGNNAADPQSREAQCCRWPTHQKRIPVTPFCKRHHTIGLICTLISWAKRPFICPFEFTMIEIWGL